MSNFLGTPQNTLITIDIKPDGQTSEQITLGAVQQFAYQVRRAKAPIYVIGSQEPITIAKGARSVAGTLSGVVLSESFQITLIKHFWIQIKDSTTTHVNHGLFRVQGKKDIEAAFGSKQSFISNFVQPFLTQLGANDANSIQDTFGNISDSTQLSLLSEKIAFDEALKLPPMYLDEIPPLNLKMVTPLKYEGNKITYEVVTFNGLEFLNNDLAISAGSEAIFESVNFIQRGVSKKISSKSTSTNKQSNTGNKQ